MTAIVTACALWTFFAILKSPALTIFTRLPATAAHELAHWIVALLSGARPGFPSLWPKRTREGWLLGSVSFNVHWLSAGFIALAPLWCLAPIAIWGLFFRTQELYLWREMIQGLFWGYLVVASVPSVPDWVIAIRNPVGSAFVVLFLLGGLQLSLGEIEPLILKLK